MDDAGPGHSTWPWFGILLALMIGEIMLGPLVSARAAPAVVMALILTAALAAVGAGRLSLLVFGIVIAVSAMESAVSATSIGVVSVGLRTMILCYVELRIIWRVLTDPTVTQDTVSAVACGYVLLGLIWGGFYALLEAERPGSFAIPAGWMRTNGGQARALMYFSLVTLSSLGQGDVLPAGPPGGGLTVAEAIVGQLHMAIMIARMVGILASRRAA